MWETVLCEPISRKKKLKKLKTELEKNQDEDQSKELTKI
jgi:hypothetical protein